MLINHKLDELYAVADHIVALVDGQVRINGPLAVHRPQEVVRAITGAEVDAPRLLPLSRRPPQSRIRRASMRRPGSHPPRRR